MVMWRSYPAPVPRLISPAAGRSRRIGCGSRERRD
uniref:Pco108605 n=1 Tax=Arundo donax TaxID=35708 RepID=A0A0A9ELN7_ARUDO